MTDRQVQPPAARPVVDYLNSPPQRYTTDKELGLVPHQHGEWQRFDDVDLYMLEGAGYMQRMLEERRKTAVAMENVASWLERGCDPQAAAKELRAMVAKL